jgi:hypothetical protein
MEYEITIMALAGLFESLDATCAHLLPDYAGMHPVSFAILVDWLRGDITSEVFARYFAQPNSDLLEFQGCALEWGKERQL